VARPALAAYLSARFSIGASLGLEGRAERKTPHLGRLDLHTKYRDALARPLPAVVPEAA
jgi:hypothetical protein